MERKELRFAGFGGQGIVLSGVVIGAAAAVFGDRFASQTQSYGPEARGGACKSEVVISDEPVDYPMAMDLQVLVTMSQEALDKYVGDLRDGGTLIVDEDLVRRLPDENGSFTLHKIPATTVAEKELGRRIVANMVMLGALVGITGIVSREELEEAVKVSVPAGTEELNLSAVKRGYELASQ
ncbi:MAG: 2-oxoacid:ferredoxin oxidoreductase subunit gamma [Bacillota bacterium]